MFAENMSDVKIISGAELEDKNLHPFFKSVYGEKKSKFLSNHGGWWYRQYLSSNAVVKDNQIAAYSAVIPTTCIIKGNEHSAVWWVDLVVAPEFRRQGLQHLLDLNIREKNKLVLGFPNELAAQIHRKHGWGVREDGKVMMLPIKPVEIKSFNAGGSILSRVLRDFSYILSPATQILNYKWSRYNSRFSYSVPSPDCQIMAKIFEKYMDKTFVYTRRDAGFLRWRYLDAPYNDELSYYMAGQKSVPSHYLISRTLKRGETKVTRILDICGDLRDTSKLKDILRLAIKDAVNQGACQITAMAWVPEVVSVLRSSGFLVGKKALFCWYSKSEAIKRMLKENKCYWTIGDSDNDEPS